ncbi:MAG: hypothetical protein EBX60_11790, partial [Betaproteobacteria bacterium]|nr:hypothetical protein [Betaproteobacteria bacterium]
QALGLVDWGECTAIAVSASASSDAHTWLAQNWDWIGRQRAALVVLHTRDAQGQAIATLTEAGMLAKIGLNDQGMAVGLNILRSIADGTKPGVPVHVLLRHALSFESLHAFRSRLAALANGPGFGAASNIPAADASGDIGSFEIAPGGWSEYQAQDGVVVHTNHFLCDRLADQQAALSGCADLDQPDLCLHRRTCARHRIRRQSQIRRETANKHWQLPNWPWRRGTSPCWPERRKPWLHQRDRRLHNASNWRLPLR